MIQIKPLAKKDLNQVVQFAIVGMNFDRYFKHDWATQLFGHYFVMQEFANSSQAIGAYQGERLVGALFARLDDGSTTKPSLWQTLAHAAVSRGPLSGAAVYEATNDKMLVELAAKKQLDGEITLLAADPNLRGQDIGSQLMAAIEKQVPGKRLYLFTDSDCNYQFYDHRGFTQDKEEAITLTLRKQQYPLTAMLYSRVF